MTDLHRPFDGDQASVNLSTEMALAEVRLPTTGKSRGKSNDERLQILGKELAQVRLMRLPVLPACSFACLQASHEFPHPTLVPLNCEIFSNDPAGSKPACSPVSTIM